MPQVPLVHREYPGWQVLRVQLVQPVLQAQLDRRVIPEVPPELQGYQAVRVV